MNVLGKRHCGSGVPAVRSKRGGGRAWGVAATALLAVAALANVAQLGERLLATHGAPKQAGPPRQFRLRQPLHSVRRGVALVIAQAPGFKMDYLPFLELIEAGLAEHVIVVGPEGDLPQSPLCKAEGVECLAWGRPTAQGELPSHMVALGRGLARADLKGAAVVIAISSVLVPLRPAARFMREMISAAEANPQTVVGASWVLIDRPNTTSSHGYSVEWDSEEVPLIRSSLSGVSYDDLRVRQRVDSTLVSPLCFAATFSVLHTHARNPISNFSTPDSVATLACRVRGYVRIGDTLSSAASFIVDTMPATASQASMVKGLRNINEDLEILLQDVRALVDGVRCNFEEEVQVRLRAVEELQTRVLNVLASCRLSHCDTGPLLQTIIPEYGNLFPVLKSTAVVLSQWMLGMAAKLAPVDQEAGFAWLLNLSRSNNGRPFVTAPARVACCQQPVRPFIPERRIRVKKHGFVEAVVVHQDVGRYVPVHAPTYQMPRKIGQDPALRALHPRFANNLTVIWDAWCCKCCGFSNEWAHYLYALERHIRIRSVPGPSCHCSGFTDDTMESLSRIHIRSETSLVVPATDAFVWVSHTPPPSFSRGEVYHPKMREPDYFVGRSMYEFSAVPLEWVAHCNAERVDEIWVPSDFVRKAFAASGVEEAKLRVVPEALDTNFYNPGLDLPAGMIPRPGWRHYSSREEVTLPLDPNRYCFLSVFKWESRKGWDVLLKGYFSAFDAGEQVTLVVATWMWYAGSPASWGATRDPQLFREHLEGVAAGFGRNPSELPHVLIVTEQLSEVEIRLLYKTCKAFVLPTRGEGWGLPIIQAMSMALPTISTAWGGATAFMTPNTSFPIRYTLTDLPRSAALQYQLAETLQWAEPDQSHMEELMRYVFTEQKLAEQVGRRARQHIVSNFNEEVVAAVMLRRLGEIERLIATRHRTSSANASHSA